VFQEPRVFVLVLFEGGPSGVVLVKRARAGMDELNSARRNTSNVRKVYIISYNMIQSPLGLLYTTPIPGISATSTFSQPETPPFIHLSSYCFPSRDGLCLHPVNQLMSTAKFGNNTNVETQGSIAPR
jgi:hypothetical protein